MGRSSLRLEMLLAMALGLAACSASNLTGSNGSDGGSSGGLNQGTIDGGDAGNGGCAQGQTSCLGACVDTETDTSNCGSCGTLCGNGQNCLGAVCACPAGGSICGNSCTSLASDDHNCGSCNHACGSGQTCSDGGCIGGAPDAGHVDGGSLPDSGTTDAGEDAGTIDGGTTCTLANLTFAVATYPAGQQPVALAIGSPPNGRRARRVRREPQQQHGWRVPEHRERSLRRPADLHHRPGPRGDSSRRLQQRRARGRRALGDHVQHGRRALRERRRHLRRTARLPRGRQPFGARGG